MTITSPSISSLGQICSTLQRPYGSLRKAIEELGITPVLVINMVAHYSDEDVERLGEYFQQPRSAKQKREG
jgi:hypothetical protein